MHICIYLVVLLSVKGCLPDVNKETKEEDVSVIYEHREFFAEDEAGVGRHNFH